MAVVKIEDQLLPLLARLCRNAADVHTQGPTGRELLDLAALLDLETDAAGLPRLDAAPTRTENAQRPARLSPRLQALLDGQAQEALKNPLPLLVFRFFAPPPAQRQKVNAPAPAPVEPPAPAPAPVEPPAPAPAPVEPPAP